MKAYYSNEILVMMTKEELEKLLWICASACLRYEDKGYDMLLRTGEKIWKDLAQIAKEVPF